MELEPDNGLAKGQDAIHRTPSRLQAALEKATRELERLAIIAAGRIERSTKGKEQLTVWLEPSG